jgi:hypothetical protein
MQTKVSAEEMSGHRWSWLRVREEGADVEHGRDWVKDGYGNMSGYQDLGEKMGDF